MNPLLEKFETPFETVPFDKIKNEHYLPALTEAIKIAKQNIDSIKNNTEEVTFDNVLTALEEADVLVNRVSKVFFNMLGAETSDELQRLAKQFSPMMSEFGNDVILDAKLFERIKMLWHKRESLELTGEQSMLLERTYKQFVRNGALLEGDARDKLREIDKELAKTALEFGDNVLAETNSYELEITDEKDLAGLPEFVKEAAAHTAEEKGKKGHWIFTLHMPSFIPFIMYADNRELREKMMIAYGSRCFKDDEKDNQDNIKNIVRLRYERANLLGYKNHAQFVLEERMAETPEAVMNFLNELLQHSYGFAQNDIDELKMLAKERDGLEDFQNWDYSYYAEKLKKHKYNIDNEMLKPFFKLESVIFGVFMVASKLYGITFMERTDIQVYHPDVKTFEVVSENGEHVGILYMDFFPRASKRSGAWMTSFRGQKNIGGIEQRPHAMVVCNFTKPTATKPSLLTFQEVTTLFHEFGHSLHGLLAKTVYPSLSGTNVFWDFVELPSQIMENWVLEKECLDLFAKHYETGEKISDELVQRIKDAANFNEARNTVRQLSLGFIDMSWHMDDGINAENVGDYEKMATEKTRLLPEVEGVSTSCSFSHIFQGGYSSGYYSYKWAEVLDADAFAYFKENGIFNREIAQKFYDNVLSKGGSEHPMELYKRFRGRKPSIDALLERAGLTKKPNL